MDKAKRVLIITVIVLLIVGISGGAIAVFGTYSSGSRVGTIIKFSKKGTLFKTYEGELSQGSVSEGGALNERWAFSVYRDDEEIITNINNAMDDGYRVRLYYKQKYFRFEWRGDTEYFIEKVERVGDRENPELEE